MSPGQRLQQLVPLGLFAVCVLLCVYAARSMLLVRGQLGEVLAAQTRKGELGKDCWRMRYFTVEPM